MGSLVQGIGNLFSGDDGSGAISAGLNSQMQMGRQAQSQLKDAYNDQKQIAQPWMDTGKTALGQLAGGKFMDNWQQDPGYQFRMQQGTNAIQGSAAAQGLNKSGATLKALANYGQNMASQEYGNVYNRESSRLSGLANLGGGMTGNAMGAAQNYGNNVANITTGLGNAQAAAGMAQAQAKQNQTGGLLGLGGQLGAAYLMSDEREKTDIKEISKADLKEFKKSITPYSFNYKNDENGKGEYAGVMAQDLQKSKLGRTVVEEHDGRKKINLHKLASLSLAMMAADKKG